MTKNDFTAILIYVDGLRSWIEAAAACLKGQQTFAESLNSFIRAGQ